MIGSSSKESKLSVEIIQNTSDPINLRTSNNNINNNYNNNNNNNNNNSNNNNNNNSSSNQNNNSNNLIEKDFKNIDTQRELLEDNENLIANDEIHTSNSFKNKLFLIMTNGYIVKILDIISVILAFFIFITYIVQTYYEDLNWQWFNIFNYIVATYYNLLFILYLYIANHRCQYLLNINTLINLYTSIFPYFAEIKNNTLYKFVEGSRVSHIFRINRFVYIYLKINENDVVKHVINMIREFIVIILFIALVFRIVEIDKIRYFISKYQDSDLENQVKFHDFIYYTVVTIATVGYGEIYPITEQGRIVIIVLIILAAYLIPKETGILLNLLEKSSIYSRELYKSNQEIPHLVICGYISAEAMISFCNELFHSDHGQSEKNVIILNPNIPNQEMRLFLHAGKFEGKILL